MKKSSRLTGLVFALMGIPPLLNSLDQPRVAALHGIEVLRLVAAGMLFGVGFVGLMVNTSVRGEYLDSPRADDFFAMASELDVPILLHPPAEPVGSAPDQFAARVQSEIAKWAKVMKDAGIPTSN
jgi:hypothetical protein